MRTRPAPSASAPRDRRTFRRAAWATVLALVCGWLAPPAAAAGEVTVTGGTTLRPQLGEPFSQTFALGGDPLPVEVGFDPALPAGLTGAIEDGRLVIAGVATGPAGPAPTTMTVSNGLTAATVDLDLAVTAPAALGEVGRLDLAVDVPITPVELTATGWPQPSVAVAGLPPGLVATPTATGRRIEGTPTTLGSWSATVSAENGVGVPAAATLAVAVGRPPSITVQESWTVPEHTTVVVPVTVTGTPRPALTATGLPGGVSLRDLGGTSWELRGWPYVAGVHQVTLTATNGIGGAATATVRLAVEGRPVVSGPSTLDLLVGTPVAFEVTATGYPIPALTFDRLPPGLTAQDDGEGRLTVVGTPTTPGTWFPVVWATNAYGTEYWSCHVVVGRAPAFAQDRLELRVPVESWLGRDLGLVGDPGPRVTVTAGALPAGVWVSTGRLEGVPVTVGRYEATLTATNTHGSDALEVVMEVVQRPDLDGREIPTVVGTADAPMTGTFRTVGWPVPTVTPLDPLPAGLTLGQDPTDPYAWQVAGTVARANCGSTLVRVSLANGVGPDVTRYIRVVVDAPLVWDSPSGATVVVPRGAPMTPVPLHLTGHPIAGSKYSSVGVTVTITTSTSTELAATLGGTLWSDATFWICARAGTFECASPQHYTHFVVRDRPVVSAPAITTAPAGDRLTIPVAVTSTHPATLAASDLPGWLSLEPDGGAWVLTGTPTAADAGPHAFTLVADNGVTGTAPVQVDVTEPPSFAGPVAGTLLVGEEAALVVTAAGYPTPTTRVDGDLPDGVSAVDDGAGGLRLLGTPTRAGSWTVDVHASNDRGDAATTLTLTVERRAAFADDAASRTVHTGDLVTWAPDVVGVPAPAVTLHAGALPPGVRLTDDGVLHGTATEGGRYDVVLRASNAHGEDLLPVRFEVLAPPVVPGRFVTYTFPADTPVSLRFRTGGWEPPTVEPLFDLLPPGLELTQVDATTWEFSGTVAEADRGYYTDAFRMVNTAGMDLFIVAWKVTAPARWSSPDVVHAETGVPFPDLDLEVAGYPLGDVLVDPGATPVTALEVATSAGPDGEDHPTTARARVTGTFTAPGEHTLTFRVGDSTHAVTFVVRDRPVVSAPEAVTLTAGAAAEIRVTVAGSPAATLAAEGLPDGLVLVPDDHGTWRITGSPASAPGTYPVTLTADNGLVVTLEMRLVVVAAPVVTDDGGTTTLPPAPAVAPTSAGRGGAGAAAPSAVVPPAVDAGGTSGTGTADGAGPVDDEPGPGSGGPGAADGSSHRARTFPTGLALAVGALVLAGAGAGVVLSRGRRTG